jgi:hypothetical protein
MEEWAKEKERRQQERRRAKAEAEMMSLHASPSICRRSEAMVEAARRRQLQQQV